MLIRFVARYWEAWHKVEYPKAATRGIRYKKNFLKIFPISIEKHLWENWKPIEKFLRTPILKNICKWLHLNISLIWANHSYFSILVPVSLPLLSLGKFISLVQVSFSGILMQPRFDHDNLLGLVTLRTSCETGNSRLKWN